MSRMVRTPVLVVFAICIALSGAALWLGGDRETDVAAAVAALVRSPLSVLRGIAGGEDPRDVRAAAVAARRGEGPSRGAAAGAADSGDDGGVLLDEDGRPIERRKGAKAKDRTGLTGSTSSSRGPRDAEATRDGSAGRSGLGTIFGGRSSAGGADSVLALDEGGAADSEGGESAAQGEDDGDGQADEETSPGENDVAALFDQLNSNDPVAIMAAIDGFETLGGTEGAAAVASVLRRNDVSSEVKLRAIRALGWIRDPASATALQGALYESDLALAFAAADALENIGGESAVDALAAAFSRSGAEGLQQRALEALAWIEGERAVELAVALLVTTSDPAIQIAAAQTLDEIYDPIAVPLLRDAYFNTNDPVLQAQLIGLIEDLGGDVSDLVPEDEA